MRHEVAMRDASANVRPGPGVIVQKYSSFYKALIVKYFSQDHFFTNSKSSSQ